MHEDGSEQVIAYASRALTKSERRYNVTRKELLAVVVFITYFRQYLLGRPFLLRTDHSALTWLKNFRNPEGQMARWLEKLEEYTFNIQHRAGKTHQNADALSRLPDIQDEIVGGVNTLFGGKSKEELRALQLTDPDLKLVVKAKESNKRPTKGEVSGESFKTRKLVQIWEQLEVTNGVLMRNYYDEKHNSSFKQLVVPSCLQAEIMNELSCRSYEWPFGSREDSLST